MLRMYGDSSWKLKRKETEGGKVFRDMEWRVVRWDLEGNFKDLLPIIEELGFKKIGVAMIDSHILKSLKYVINFSQAPFYTAVKILSTI